MAQLVALRPPQVEDSDTLMRAEGYAVWLAWSGEFSPVVAQILEDYGALSVAESRDQALCFFFSADVFFAAARLRVWSRFNPLVMSLHIFPARLLAGKHGSKDLVCDASVWALEETVPADFTIRVHNSLWQEASSNPGLGITEKSEDNVWGNLSVDVRLPYQFRQSWYSLLRPVGNPVDKDFQTGWREFFHHIEIIVQRCKFRFSVHDFNVMFQVDSLRQLKTWCKEYLQLVEKLKAESPASYWPCLLAVVERKGLLMNEDLPARSNVPWQHLVPDYPHMHMQTGFLLGGDFKAHSVRFAAPTGSPEDWASVSLSLENDSGTYSLPQMLSPALVLGREQPCFYCGQTSHIPENCPSRLLNPLEGGIWTEMAKFDLEQIQSATATIESNLADPADEAAKREYISQTIRKDEAPGVVLRAFYDLAWPVQARSMSFFWRLRSKDVNKAAKNLLPVDKHLVWHVLEDFLSGQERCKEAAQNLSVQYPNDYRVLSLMGFISLEKGEMQKAERFWTDAERNSPNLAIQAWHTMLLARLQECQGKYAAALKLYEQAGRSFSTWQEPVYRKVICLVKSGFSQTALTHLVPLIEKNGHIFNRALIDPELERGYIHVHRTLGGLWTVMEARAKMEMARLRSMRDELGVWFVPGNDFAQEMAEHIGSLMQLGAHRNYVPFQRLCAGRASLEKELQGYVSKEAKEFKNRFRAFTEQLKVIYEGSVWFPFPGALVEFNKSYRQSVSNVNWALRTNFHSPEAFKKAQVLLDKEADRLKKLEKRLAFLRIIRDSTLFILSVLEGFFWLMVVGLLCIFVVLPLIVMYSDKLGLDVANSIFIQERWQVQKVLLFVVTVIAVSVAVLKTVLRFERIREKILAKAKAKKEAVKNSRSKKVVGTTVVKRNASALKKG